MPFFQWAQIRQKHLVWVTSHTHIPPLISTKPDQMLFFAVWF